MTDRQSDRQTEWNDNKAHSLRCERDATDGGRRRLLTRSVNLCALQVVINTEWGAFGDNDCLDFMRTQIDKDIDTTSINPGQHKYAPFYSFLLSLSFIDFHA